MKREENGVMKIDTTVIQQPTYDEYGHVIEKNRTYKGHGSLLTKYAYNKSQIISTTYPGGLVESYVYDSNGFKIQTKVGDKVICNLDWYDGLIRKTSFMDKLKRQSIRNNQGYMTDQMVSIGNLILDRHSTTYEHSTKNLLCRQRLGNPQEVFGYDELDRLKTIQTEGNLLMSLDYAANGNILRKSDVGSYTYDANGNKPHAVKTIDNPVGTLKNSSLKSSFNELGRVQQIIYDVSNLTMDIVYGPDLQRWYSELLDNSGAIRTSMYAENYERITDNGVSREFYYLDGNVIVVRENGGEFVPYHAFKDNLGSFLSIIDCNGDKVFDADYDAWGKQTVHLNEIGFQRGYTGHEMWNEFGIINMNGRLYDPTIARFLSPDNYVQAPDNSQNFNRYSYCLNNPLKYNDPSGEFWEWVIAGAIMGAIQSGAMAEMNEGKNFWSGAWKGAIVGGFGSAAGIYAGSAMANCVGTAGLWAGAAVGACSGGANALINGAGTAWINGASFVNGLLSGLTCSALGATISGFTGAIEGGFDAMSDGKTFWKGREIDRAIYLKNVDVYYKNIPSYNRAVMNIINQIYNTDYSLTTASYLLPKAWWHYQFGGKEPMFVDASTLDFSRIHQSDVKNRRLQTFKLGNLNNTSLTIGNVNVESSVGNQYKLSADLYDFDLPLKKLKDFRPNSMFRNFGTFCSSALHNTICSWLWGGEYEIVFIGDTVIMP